MKIVVKKEIETHINLHYGTVKTTRWLVYVDDRLAFSGTGLSKKAAIAEAKDYVAHHNEWRPAWD